MPVFAIPYILDDDLQRPAAGTIVSRFIVGILAAGFQFIHFPVPADELYRQFSE